MIKDLKDSKKRKDIICIVSKQKVRMDWGSIVETIEIAKVNFDQEFQKEN